LEPRFPVSTLRGMDKLMLRLTRRIQQSLIN
jgi:hypothetical protein